MHEEEGAAGRAGNVEIRFGVTEDRGGRKDSGRVRRASATQELEKRALQDFSTRGRLIRMRSLGLVMRTEWFSVQ